jgi:flagellar basal-body rod protein FlgB
MTQPTPLLSTLETYLKLTNTRAQAISANMANVDTPGYRTHDINFESELRRATAMAPAPSPVDTADSTGTVHFAPVVREVPGLLERPDGNNVNLDREGLLLAESQLQYQLGVQLIKGQFHQILSAINGGN